MKQKKSLSTKRFFGRTIIGWILMTIVVLALLAGTMSLLPYEITVPIAAVALILYFLSFLFKKSKS